jgi:uncharacterized protein YutE (UPF0331/DUF86 family)
MMQIEAEKIKKRVAEINEAKEGIVRIVSLSDKELLANKESMAALKYYLLQIVEAVGSICVHIAAKKFNKGVSAFGECFEILNEEGLLNDDLTLRLRKMAKFRNKLMHQYWGIDDVKILEYAKKDLGDIDDFIRAINSLV